MYMHCDTHIHMNYIVNGVLIYLFTMDKNRVLMIFFLNGERSLGGRRRMHYIIGGMYKMHIGP
jgi:hypothetical protein